MNGLCWIDPFDNRGTWDCGWNCREHAWFTALLARSLGHNAVVMHGAACFVPRLPRFAAGLGILQDPHAWVGVEGFGLLDFSIKPSGTLRGATGEMLRYGDTFPLQAVFGSRGPGDGPITVAEAREFRRKTVTASQARGKAAAIYWGREYDTLTPAILRDASTWINSPLTVRLDMMLKPGFYLRALFYLHDLITSVISPLSDKGVDAWRSIDERYDWVTIGEALALLRLNESAT